MGREHADKVCAVRRPEFDENGWFQWKGITFVQACGETAAATEDFFVQVIEDVRK